MTAVTAAMMILTGCAGGDSLSAGSNPPPTPQTGQTDVSEDAAEAPSEAASEVADELAADDDDGPDAGQVEDWQYPATVVDGPVSFSPVDGLTLEIVDVQVNDLAAAPDDVVADFEFALDDEGSQTLFGVQMKVINDTDMDVSWYPTQATLVVGGVSLEANLFLSDSLTSAQGEILAGTSAQADVFYEAPNAASEFVSGEARLKGSAPYEAESFDTLGEDLDVTFAWQPE